MQNQTTTPLMKQYQDIKAKNPGVILFFRLGDFYEMFDEQAREVSSLLGLTLTARHGTPMCGIPYHAANNYIVRLLKAGKKIAICEQVGSAAENNTKLFERKVIRVITPGTVMEDTLLTANQSNYLVYVMVHKNGWALACVDVSTGEFWVTQNDKDPSLMNLAAALAAINPAEIAGDQASLKDLQAKVVIPAGFGLTTRPAFDGDYTLPASWPALGAWDGKRAALSCALQVMRYINVTEPSFKETLIPSYRELKETLIIDENAVNALELVQTQEGGRKGSLWDLLDKTQTSGGSRMLKEWILHPLLNPQDIAVRQNSVEGFIKAPQAVEEVQAILKNISDVERITTRTATGTASPRDMSGLRRSLLNAEPLHRWFEKFAQVAPQLTQEFEKSFTQLQDMSRLLYSAINEDPPLRISDGNIIREGYNADLDELRSLRHNSGKTLEEICAREREKTGIPTMKVGFNSVFGYISTFSHNCY